MQSFLFDNGERCLPQVGNTASSSSELELLAEKAKECQNCTLAETRLNVVFGEGNPFAGVAIIGEAPGAEENASGRPFVGRSGQLLDTILKAAGFSRQEVYICNIVKCRPPGNRNPLKDEIKSCRPWLLKQLQIVKPKVILILGKVAANTIFENRLALGAMRGKMTIWNEFECFITFHPAAVLRNPHLKKEWLEDIQLMTGHYETVGCKKNARENEN